MKLMVFLGTRPELIKLAPVIKQAQKKKHEVIVVLTGQHEQLLAPLLKFFEVKADHVLQVMEPGQSLTELSEKILREINAKKFPRADYVLVQGDTTSAFMAAYWAYLQKIPVVHVEAGLRTYDLNQPFPEEANRQLISRIADIHFVPTSDAQKNLQAERVNKKSIFKVGNTAIDSMHYVLNWMENSGDADPNSSIFEWVGDRKLILVTTHRRENFGEGMKDICRALQRLLREDKTLCVVIPVHPNPAVRQVVEQELSSLPQVKLIEPQPYVAFISLMKRASILLTDSGGVQEEGPTLKKPILVLRETTERPEGVKMGFSKLVGTNPEKIIKACKQALKKGCQAKGKNPYGDGKTSERIVSILEKHNRR